MAEEPWHTCTPLTQRPILICMLAYRLPVGIGQRLLEQGIRTP